MAAYIVVDALGQSRLFGFGESSLLTQMFHHIFTIYFYLCLLVLVFLAVDPRRLVRLFRLEKYADAQMLNDPQVFVVVRIVGVGTLLLLAISFIGR